METTYADSWSDMAQPWLSSQYDVWVSSVTFVSGLFIGTNVAFQQRVLRLFTIRMCKNDGLENYLQKEKKKRKFLIFSHPGDSVSLEGVWESGCSSWRLPIDPGGITCMLEIMDQWYKDSPRKIFVGQWPIFHDPLILPFIIVIGLKYFFLYIKKWFPAGVFVPL